MYTKISLKLAGVVSILHHIFNKVLRPCEGYRNRHTYNYVDVPLLDVFVQGNGIVIFLADRFH